jgi:hypothetical protein
MISLPFNILFEIIFWFSFFIFFSSSKYGINSFCFNISNSPFQKIPPLNVWKYFPFYSICAISIMCFCVLNEVFEFSPETPTSSQVKEINSSNPILVLYLYILLKEVSFKLKFINKNNHLIFLFIFLRFYNALQLLCRDKAT